MTRSAAACWPETIRVVDSHTEGEPTRVVVEGWPHPAGDTMEARRRTLGRHFDHLRRAVVLEPRGHEAVVGALLVDAVSAEAEAGIIFFNNLGYLGMCGHGLMGVARTLGHLGRLGPGEAWFDTPAGRVSATLLEDGGVSIRNVPAHVHAADVAVEVEGLGRVRGDVAWGGNWFFLTELPGEPLEIRRVGRLSELAGRIMRALGASGITGADGAQIDHVNLSAPSTAADARSFVLCPGGAWDRSPCGTGTSALLAALHARGRLPIGRIWHQESVTGGRFEAWLEEVDGELVPHVRGRAFITGESTLLFDPADPFRAGYGQA